MFYAMNKLRRSTYLCTPSGNRKQGKSLVCAQFVHSTHFFLTPQKGAVKKLSFFYSSFLYLLGRFPCPHMNLTVIRKLPQSFFQNDSSLKEGAGRLTVRRRFSYDFAGDS